LPGFLAITRLRHPKQLETQPTWSSKWATAEAQVLQDPEWRGRGVVDQAGGRNCRETETETDEHRKDQK